MKNINSKLIVTAIIGFTGALAWIFLMVFILAMGDYIKNKVDFLWWMGVVIPSLAGIYYIWRTNFGIDQPNEK